MRCPNKSSGKGRDPPRAHSLVSDVVAPILVGLAYFTFAYLGLRFASLNSSATPIWPPTGLAIAAMLLWGHRIAPAISHHVVPPKRNRGGPFPPYGPPLFLIRCQRYCSAVLPPRMRPHFSL